MSLTFLSVFIQFYLLQPWQLMKALAKARKGMNEKLNAVWTSFFLITLH